ncbi:MAG: hypothetical protein JKY04_01210 [Sneathiella sp.]|nr:hypothetical protein [Sneathiella sp.]
MNKTKALLFGVLCFLLLTLTACKPTATSDRYGTRVNTAVQITLKGKDSDNDPLTYSLASQPLFGSLSGDMPNLIYTPAEGYIGDDSFTFLVNDGKDDSAIATIELIVFEKAGKAILGPVVNAGVKVFAIGDTTTPIYETRTTNSSDLQLAGLIPLPSNNIVDENTLYLVTVTKGKDIDANDDGVLDTKPTSVNGTFHGIFKGSHILSGNWNVSAVTDAIYYRIKILLEFGASEQSILDEINYRTRLLIGEDITGDNRIDIDDLIQWHPINNKSAFRRSDNQLNNLITKIHSNGDAEEAADQLTKSKSDISNLTFSNRVYAPKIESNHLYVPGDEGLSEYDISIPDAPVFVRLMQFPPSNFSISQGLALAFNYYNIAVSNLNEDGVPAVQQIETDTEVRFATIISGTLIVADMNNYIHIYEQDNNAEYKVVRSHLLSVSITDITTVGTTALMADGGKIHTVPTDMLLNANALEIETYLLNSTIQKHLLTEGSTLYFTANKVLTEVTFKNGVITNSSAIELSGDDIAVTSKYIYSASEGATTVSIYHKNTKEQLGSLPLLGGLDGIEVFGDYLVEYGIGVEDIYHVIISDAQAPPVSSIFSEFSADQPGYMRNITGNESELYMIGYSGIKRIDLDESGAAISGQQLSIESHRDGLLVDDLLVTSTHESLVIYKTNKGTTLIKIGAFQYPYKSSDVRILNVQDNYVFIRFNREFLIVDIASPEIPQHVISMNDLYIYRGANLKDKKLAVSSYDGLHLYDFSIPESPILLGQWQVPFNDHNGIQWAVPYEDYFIVKGDMDDPTFYTLSLDQNNVFHQESKNGMGKQGIFDTFIFEDNLYAVTGSTLVLNKLGESGKILTTGEVTISNQVEHVFSNTKGIYMTRQGLLTYIKFPK